VKWVARVVALVVLAVGVMFLALAPNTTPEEGAADPILELRRSALGFLRAIGVVESPSFFFGGGYLPTTGGAEVGLDTIEWRMEIDREPVYRGLFWVVGDRMTYRTTDFVDPPTTRRALRFCYFENGKKFVVGESTSALSESPATSWEVQGYVPRSATGYGVEEVDANGAVSWINRWGDPEGLPGNR